MLLREQAAGADPEILIRGGANHEQSGRVVYGTGNYWASLAIGIACLASLRGRCRMRSGYTNRRMRSIVWFMDRNCWLLVCSQWVSIVLRRARHTSLMGHFANEIFHFHAIIRTVARNNNQEKTKPKHKPKQTGPSSAVKTAHTSVHAQLYVLPSTVTARYSGTLYHKPRPWCTWLLSKIW